MLLADVMLLLLLLLCLLPLSLQLTEQPQVLQALNNRNVRVALQFNQQQQNMLTSLQNCLRPMLHWQIGSSQYAGIQILHLVAMSGKAPS